MKNISGPAKEARDLILLTPNYFLPFNDISGQLFIPHARYAENLPTRERHISKF
ncbi:MAG: hypothetical protein IMF09_00545 [Proteobacteria bacterium]|nr:hypothetical protein [Pseudomonadota bacterium]